MEDNIPNGIPPFDGRNFEYWKNRMETYLKALGVDVWFSVASGYNALKKPKVASQKEAKRNNKMAIDTILDGLTNSVKSKVGSCASGKSFGTSYKTFMQGKKQKKKLKLKKITTSQISNRGRFFCFNCEGVGHVEFECPHQGLKEMTMKKKKIMK
jgi:hypothetical protein